MTELAHAEELFRELQHAEEDDAHELAFDVAAAINAVTIGLNRLGAPKWLVKQVHTRASLRLARSLDPAARQGAAVAGSWRKRAMSEAVLSGDATSVAALARYSAVRADQSQASA